MPQSIATEELRLDPVLARLSEEWVRKHGAAYVGQWVALRGDEFLGASRSFLELSRQVPPDAGHVIFMVID
jgi:hypothetical protein